ncbi:GDSL-type esterase/lipase family protein [Blastopirellula sp. J2-11]|uniref:SGNH/GDSL hydrolase family protein n=1 Tax=Blastopirellula sp. J2-11 TaxID=2943192 RepID=UPI0021C94F28|nr:SGNH/GDSL hydrolase family protein [Blastopirellula sp. J2-11]UUO07764.1 GDSL-type esterase/lipase family protein [Blastopirellula sp. J2-11]
MLLSIWTQAKSSNFISAINNLVLPVFVSGIISTACFAAENSTQLTLPDDWEVQVHCASTGEGSAFTAAVSVPPPAVLAVAAERHNGLPIYNPQASAYARGARLEALKSDKFTASDLLVAESVIVRSGPAESDSRFLRGQDYELESRWGRIGRLPNGRIKEGDVVYVSYRHALPRIDSIFLGANGAIEYRTGQPRAETPVPPECADGQRRLANIWIPGPIERLTTDHLFPIMETAYPESAAMVPRIAEQRIPHAIAKLRSGETLRILAWGDSVTDGAYLKDPERDRWQSQFVHRLKKRFPTANIELITEAWGGRTTGSYLAAPLGQPHNFQQTVLDVRPDLIISEFVNDAHLNEARVEERYGKLLSEFQKINAEWIILTPHYVRPDWMDLDRQRDIDDDPRPYVKGLRSFAAKHQLALADASLRYGRLWRQGIPYNTLMVNCINHPNASGLAIFADALMELMPRN